MPSKAFSGTLRASFPSQTARETFQSNAAPFRSELPKDVEIGPPVKTAPFEVAMAASSAKGKAHLTKAFDAAHAATFGPPPATGLIFADGTKSQHGAEPGYTLALSDDTPPASPLKVYPSALIENQLAVSNPTVTEAQREAVYLCLLYARAAARAEVGTEDPFSKSFFDAVVSQLTSLGFTVQKTTNENTITKHSSVQTLLSEIAKAALNGQSREVFDAINTALTDLSAPKATREALKAWWDNSTSNTQGTKLAWSFISASDGAPVLNMIVLEFSHSISFGSIERSERTEVTSFAVSLKLDMATYASEEAELKEKLGDYAEKYIKQVDLDL